MMWWTAAWALQPCPVGAQVIGPGDALAELLESQRHTGRIQIGLETGVYSDPIDLHGYVEVELCALEPGVILSGSHQPALIHGASGEVRLKNLILAPSNTSAVSIELDAGGLTLDEATVTPTGIGSAVVVTGSGTVDIVSSLFVGGTADRGAHVVLDGALEATFEGSVFLNGVAFDGGGSTWAATEVALTVEKSTFRNNRGGWGGAIATHGRLTVEESTFEANRAECAVDCVHQRGDGGAIWSDNPALSLTRSSMLTGNQASNDGGALSVALGEASVVRELTLCKNSAGEDGGALHTQEGSTGVFGQLRFLDNVARRGGAASGPVDFTNVNLLGNAATVNGAAVHCSSSDRDCEIRRSLIAYNAQVASLDERVDAGASVFWGNAGNQEYTGDNVVADPILRGYRPGGACSRFDDFPGPLSPVVGVGDPGRIDALECMGQCLPPPEMGSAYGSVGDVDAGFAAQAWTDEDGDAWPRIFDCDDSNADDDPGENYKNPLGIDQDCDGEFDYDGDGDGVLRGEDCDDRNGSRKPGVPDEDPLEDADCDGVIEDRIPTYRASGCGRRVRFNTDGGGCGASEESNERTSGLPATSGLLLGMLMLARRSQGPRKR